MSMVQVNVDEVPSRDERMRPAPRFQPRPTRKVWSLNVLLVDDDQADTSLILNVLRRHPNVSRVHASDAPEVALREMAAGQLRPDLLLLDIHMPRVNGFEFLKALRRLPDMDAVPVVFLTTSGLGDDVMSAMDSSASLYVIKPDTYAELEIRLDGIIARAISGVWGR
jgi:DNA-binding response OmpR family regulator